MTRILLLTLAFMPTAGFAAREFDDVSFSHESRDAILELRERGVLQGYPDGNFYPDVRINRVEFTKIVIGALYGDVVIEDCLKTVEFEELEQGTDINYRELQELLAFEETKFKDVDYNEWYGPYLCTAQRENIVGGYEDGTFKPEQRVNFAEAATILARAFNILKASRHLTPDQIWYRPFVQDMSDVRAVPDSISGFDYLITRSEMAEMIHRLVVHREAGGLTRKPHLTYSEIVKSGEWKTYKNEELGFQFDYAKDWEKPYYVPRGFFDGGHPKVTSDWRMYLGPEATCTGFGDCIERHFHLDGFDPDLNVLGDMADDPLVTIVSDRTMNDARVVVFEQVGICVSRSALIFGEKHLYKLRAVC